MEQAVRIQQLKRHTKSVVQLILACAGKYIKISHTKVHQKNPSESNVHTRVHCGR